MIEAPSTGKTTPSNMTKDRYYTSPNNLPVKIDMMA